jgi:hypothetical protein
LSGSSLPERKKRRIIILNSLGHAKILVALVFLGAQLHCEKNIESYLHKNAILAVPPLSSAPPAELQNPERKPISPREACYYAIEHCKTKGIKHIVICEVQWIAAPLSGYLIDLTGKLTIDHEEYITFRIGIMDGCEEDAEKNPAGREFVFIAFGKTTEGKTLWYPQPGPDYKPAEGEATPESYFIYEFLLNRDRFETLLDRYP